MSDVQFQSDQQDEFGRPPAWQDSGITGKLVSWGLAKDRKQAEYVLIGVLVAVVLISIYVYVAGDDYNPPPQVTETIIYN